MAITSGTKLGPFEIVSALGAGGMGEVYRARDTRLDRTVAIKVLPIHLSSDSELRQRFAREARAISSLSHPHICHLYDVGHQDGIDYLVMEYLQGETLAERLSRGRLQFREIVRIGSEIASGLDKAHRCGIVHRDLKPGNVMITQSGAKLMDFGLAKPTALARSATSASGGPITPSTPTISIPALASATSPLTAQGSILGTFQYMAPEVLQGGEADARSDIFSFGCVLYEMATGQRAFAGKSHVSVLAAILEKEPEPISRIQPTTPEELDRIVRTCLAKDPEERFTSAHDLKLQLQSIRESAVRQSATPRLWRRDLLLGVAVLVLAAVSTFAFLRFARQESPVLRFSVLLPGAGSHTEPVGFAALSPDGSKVALLAPGPNGVPVLWVRALGSADAKALPETEHANLPFWSPDSKQIAFFADRKLKKIDLSGGRPEVLANVSTGRGGSWSSDGVIIFAPGLNSPIMRIGASGGDPQQVTELDSSAKEISHRFPTFLPDGKHFLYFTRGTSEEVSGVYVGAIGSREKKRILRDSSNAVFANGHLLFVRGEQLVAQPFDLNALMVYDEPRPLASGVNYIRAYDGAEVSASNNGTVAFGPAYSPISKLVWLDRRGVEIGGVGQPGHLRTPTLSPNGRMVAYARLDPRNNDGDLWIFDLQRNSESRLTYEPMWYSPPVWSPKSDQLAFTGNRKGSWTIFIRDLNSDKERQLSGGAEAASYRLPTSWSSDGRYIAYQNTDPKHGWDIWVASLEDGKAVPFLTTEFSETSAQFSPDSKWLAYVSDEGGAPDVYIRPFPGPGTKIRISNAGGTRPKWRKDGKELLYVNRQGDLMAVDLNGGPQRAGPPKKLFPLTHLVADVLSNTAIDVSGDAQRVLVQEAVPGDYVPRVEFIVNWPAEIRK